MPAPLWNWLGVSPRSRLKSRRSACVKSSWTRSSSIRLGRSAMLWYKTWRETRTRLLISAMALAWVCCAIILTQHGNRAHADPPISYDAYIWKAVYKGYVRDFFIILVIVLGGGGLLQERAHGTAGFTLALPVSRSRLMGVRAAVG